jgi:hypothetical protein
MRCGAPIRRANWGNERMSIPFTQYVLPRGHRREEQIERPEDIEDIAKRFIQSGGRYECEVLTTGHVSLTAVHELDGEDQDVEIIVCANGPEIPEKVDELVRLSEKHIATP